MEANETVDDLSPRAQVDAIVRSRWVWRVLAVLFCIPALFFMIGPEKRVKEAKATGNVQAARDAVNSMRLAALIGTPIGIAILLVRIFGDNSYY